MRTLVYLVGGLLTVTKKTDNVKFFMFQKLESTGR